MNLGLLAERVAARTPRATAVMSADGTAMDFATLARRARSLAYQFRARGIYPGEPVALAMSNHESFFEILLGAWQAGLIVAPMNSRLLPAEAEVLMADCGARLCIATPDLAQGIAAISSRDVLDVDGDTFRRASAGEDANPAVELPAGAAAWLFYTSGTTGRAKGATLTHHNLQAMIDSFLADSGCAVDEAMLHTAPLSHAGGLLGLAFLQQGLPQVVMPTGALDAPAVRRALLLHRRSSLFAVPTLLNRLADPDFLGEASRGRVAKIMFGGAPMYAQDLKRAIAALGAMRLWGGYGQGEAPCTIAHIPSELLADSGDHDREELLGSVGIPRTGVELRIADESGQALPVGEAGEVQVRGRVVMAGYWNDQTATDKAFQDGWLRTGDIGRVGSTGLLTLVDRAKDMVISGGSNIYPREIEETLLRHPAVREAAVVGCPDREWGEVPVAFVVLRTSATAAELDKFCLASIARYKRPREYRFVEELPKSSYGKILKAELRATLDARHLANPKEIQ